MKYYIRLNKNNKIISMCKYHPNFKRTKDYILIETDKTIYVGHSTYINGVVNENQPAPKIIDTNQILYRKEIQQIKRWLADNDWKINKIVIGEWTTEDPRWQDYITQRNIKRQRYDELMTKLGD